MSKLFALTVPILPGQTETWKNFTNELKTSRLEQFKESRKKLGVHERTFLQHTPMGDFIIVTLEGDDPAGAFAKFAEADDEFTNWFTGKVKDMHGIDLKQPPQGPLPELVIDTQQ